MAVLTSSGEHFAAAEFDGLLADHGTPVLWRKMRGCPCFDPRSGQAELDCPFCENGILWDAGSQVTLLAPGRSRKDSYEDVGLLMQGMVTLTFPSSFTPGHLDRLDFLAAEMVVNQERHQRGAVDRTSASKERLRLTPVSVESIEAIVANVLTAYTSPAHYAVNGAGTITWVTGQGPPNGAQYVVRYRARASYVVWSPQSRDEHAQKMPYRAMAQRLDFFWRPAVGA